MRGRRWVASDFADGGLGLVAPGFHGLEDGGVFELEPDPEAEGHQQGGDQEGDAPAEAQEVFFGQGQRQDGECAVGHQVAGGRADLCGRGPESAAVRVAEFAGEQDGAAPFAADADALGEAEEHQDGGGDDADVVIRGQQADEEGGDADQHQRDDQDLLAADLVPEPAEDDAADGAGNVSHGVGGEGQQGARYRVRGREEDERENDRRRGGVDGEVVELQRGSGQAGRECLVHVLAPHQGCFGSTGAIAGGVAICILHEECGCHPCAADGACCLLCPRLRRCRSGHSGRLCAAAVRWLRKSRLR